MVHWTMKPYSELTPQERELAQREFQWLMYLGTGPHTPRKSLSPWRALRAGFLRLLGVKSTPDGSAQ
jgi:hypothetical protein